MESDQTTKPTKGEDMNPKYTINKHEGEHLDYINRLHLSREWNRRVKAMDAKLSFRSFAKLMRIRESSWRREYRRGGGITPVRDLRFPNRWLYGPYDPDLAQQDANERAAQKGPRQKLLKPVADRIRDLVKELDRHRSLFDALLILKQASPGLALPCLRTLYNHVRAGDIGLTYDDLPYRRKHKRKRNPAHPARTVVGRRKLDERPAEAVIPTEAGHLQCDTVVSCAKGSGGVFVLYDRLSRRYWLEKLACIDQNCVVKAIRRIRASSRIGQIRSVVTDNGCEFLDQAALDKAFQAKVYYTRAYASYEKGGVENCNRILRRWFPKGTDFRQVSPQRIHQVEHFINAMHRASLNGQTAQQRDEELCHVL
jgi:IS30 family transposase